MKNKQFYDLGWENYWFRCLLEKTTQQKAWIMFMLRRTGRQFLLFVSPNPAYKQAFNFRYVLGNGWDFKKIYYFPSSEISNDLIFCKFLCEIKLLLILLAFNGSF